MIKKDGVKPEDNKINKVFLKGVFLSFLAFILLGLFFAFTPTKIYGGAWVNMEGGQSEICRGLEIVLLSKEAKKDFERLVFYRPPSAYYDLRDSLDSFEKAVSEKVIKSTKTGIDGKYELTGVRRGNYYIYARYESSFSLAYWWIPLSVKLPLQPIKLDLDNSNMAEVINF